MLRSRKKLVAALLAVIFLPLTVWLGLYLAGAVPAPGKPILPPFNLSDRISTLRVEESETGELSVIFENENKKEAPVVMAGDEFLREVESRNAKTPWLYKFLDITAWTGILWVGFGFLAQIIFTGRMIVQWWASEKLKVSVVPTAFWWLSLIGASMLVIYFTWRKDIVGVAGQATGWIIYVRNLWFIYGRRDGADG